MGRIQSWKCVVGDEVKVFLNLRALKERRFYFGTVIKRPSSIIADVFCPKLNRAVRVHVKLLRVIKPVVTQGRLKKQLGYRFNISEQKKKVKKEKLVTNTVGDMKFTYKK